MVTSKNCSGLRRIFLVARQAIVMVWLSGVARRRRAAGRPAQHVGGGRPVSASEERSVIGSPPG